MSAKRLAPITSPTPRSSPSDISRRAFLGRVGGIVIASGLAPALLAACGTSSGSEETATQGTVGETATQGTVGGTLTYLGWQGEDLPGSMKVWKEAHGVTVEATYIAGLDDIPAKVLPGDSGVSLIDYTSGATDRFLAYGKLLTPIDESQVPNIKNLHPYFRDDPDGLWSDSSGALVGIPWSFGAMGLTYDSKAIAEPTSYYDLLRPEFKGKVGVLDYWEINMQAAAQMLGLNPSQLPKDKFDAVEGFLEKLLKQTKGLSPTQGDIVSRFLAGGIVASFAGYTSLNAFAAAGGNNNIKTNIHLEQPTFSFVELYAVPPDAPNATTAYAFVNEVLVPKVNAASVEELSYVSPVPAAVEYLSPQTKSLFPYDDFDAGIKDAPVIGSFPPESDEFVTSQQASQSWDNLKAGA